MLIIIDILKRTDPDRVRPLWKALFLIGLFFIFSSSCLASEVLINEILPNPESGNEWVEFYNPDKIDISNWILEEKTGSGDFNQYNLGDYLTDNEVFDIFTFTSNKLNNDGDTVRIRNADGVVDQYTFNKTEKGVSFGRYPNGEDHWHLLSSLTQGGANAAPVPSPSPSPQPEADQPLAGSPSPSSTSSSPNASTNSSPSSSTESDYEGENPSPSPVIKQELEEEEEKEEFTGEVFGEETSSSAGEEKEEKEEEENNNKFIGPLLISASGAIFLGLASFPFLKPRIYKFWQKLKRKRRSSPFKINY